MSRFLKILSSLAVCLVLMFGCFFLTSFNADTAFKSVAEAKAMLRELADRPLYREIMDSDWLLYYDIEVSRANRMAKATVRSETQFLADAAALCDELNALYDAPQYAQGDTPRIYIQTNKLGSGVARSIGQDAYIEVFVAAVDKEGSETAVVSSSEATIRVRGNSTAKPAKKPYNIKFPKKVSLFGMEPGKKWCLLADYYDKTLLRNKIAYEFAELIELPNAIDTRTVEVYLNGFYSGVYLLTEPVSDGRLDLKEKDGDYLFVYQNGRDGRQPYTAPKSKMKFSTDAPKDEDMTEEQKEMFQLWLNEIESAIYSGSYQQIRMFIDLDSFAKMYVMDELFKNVDMVWNSTYYYLKDEVLYAGPLWDRDLSMGNIYETAYEYLNVTTADGKVYGDGGGDSATGLYANKGWNKQLLKYEFFQTRVKYLYELWIPDIEALYADGGVIDSYVEEFGDAFHRNYTDAPWDVGYNPDGYGMRDTPDTYEENVEMLKDWLYRRDMWLREYFGID